MRKALGTGKNKTLDNRRKKMRPRGGQRDIMKRSLSLLNACALTRHIGIKYDAARSFRTQPRKPVEFPAEFLDRPIEGSVTRDPVSCRWR